MAFTQNPMTANCLKFQESICYVSHVPQEMDWSLYTQCSVQCVGGIYTKFGVDSGSAEGYLREVWFPLDRHIFTLSGLDEIVSVKLSPYQNLWFSCPDLSTSSIDVHILSSQHGLHQWMRQTSLDKSTRGWYGYSWHQYVQLRMKQLRKDNIHPVKIRLLTSSHWLSWGNLQSHSHRPPTLSHHLDYAETANCASRIPLPPKGTQLTTTTTKSATSSLFV